MGRKPQEKNCAAPGHVIRVDPRMLSTAQTVSPCGPGLGLKELAEALAFLVSDKEGRAIMGRHWALRAGKVGAHCKTPVPHRQENSLPWILALTPQLWEVSEGSSQPAPTPLSQPVSSRLGETVGETNGLLVSPTPGAQARGPNERPLFSREGDSQGQPPGSSVCPRTGPALLGCHVPRVAAASST